MTAQFGPPGPRRNAIFTVYDRRNVETAQIGPRQAGALFLGLSGGGGARAIHHDHQHYRGDDADDEDRYAQRECPASPVNLPGQGAMRF